MPFLIRETKPRMMTAAREIIWIKAPAPTVKSGPDGENDMTYLDGCQNDLSLCP